jgi:hypothetical protein
MARSNGTYKTCGKELSTRRENRRDAKGSSFGFKARISWPYPPSPCYVESENSNGDIIVLQVYEMRMTKQFDGSFSCF